jgi:hypothetical protein
VKKNPVAAEIRFLNQIKVLPSKKYFSTGRIGCKALFSKAPETERKAGADTGLNPSAPLMYGIIRALSPVVPAYITVLSADENMVSVDFCLPCHPLNRSLSDRPLWGCIIAGFPGSLQTRIRIGPVYSSIFSLQRGTANRLETEPLT